MLDVDLLRIETLTDMINEFKVGDISTILGLLPRNEGVGQEVNWDILGAERDVDTFEGQRSPAGTRKLQVIGNRGAKLARTFKSTFVPGSVLMDLRNPGTESRQRVAEDTIARELRALSNLIDRQNAFMISQAIQGSIAMTIDGLQHTVDYGFASSHKPTVGAGVAIAWSDPAADIVGDITGWKTMVAEDSGYQLDTVITSSEVIQSLIKNDFVGSFFASTPEGTQALREGKIGRFQGLNWVAYDQNYKPDGGSVTRYIDKRKVILLPAPDVEWGFFRVGSDVIPSDDKRSMQETIGRYAYSTLSENPASVALYAGEVRLPIIRVPNAIIAATVEA